MRGKKAKLIRRKAEARTIGMPPIAYSPITVHVKVTPPTPLNPRGEFVDIVDPITMKNCTRKKYKEIKHNYKMISRGVSGYSLDSAAN